MLLVCQVILEDNMIKGSYDCDSGGMIFLVVEGKNSTFFCINPPALFSLKHMVYHVRI